jgi:Rrf2 family transcriptional repressor of oqxAB
MMNAHMATRFSWFRVAAQGLVILAETGRACPSATMAKYLKAHAVFVRRVMAHMVQARIVMAREGRDGGYYLARPADSITLAEVYQAVTEAYPAEDTAVDLYVKKSVQQALNEVESEIEQHLLALLNHYTIASLIEHPELSL